jgi:hypothetical protein
MQIHQRQQPQPFRVIASVIQHTDLEALQFSRVVENADRDAVLLAFDVVEGAD